MNNEYKLTLKKILGHFNTINKHRFYVFKFCCKVGIPFRGLVHDLSKYSPVEFFEGAKYYHGKLSPLKLCKKNEGYSIAWLHHRGVNKHHYEYWYDPTSPNTYPIIPFKYMLEMICDNLSASITYQGKNWTKEYQLSYWNKVKEDAALNKKLKKFLTKVYEEVAEKGIDEVITKKHLKELYDKYTK